jgi:predicted alpha/beta-fold hydrolase
MTLITEGQQQGRALLPPKEVLEETEDEYRRRIYGTGLDDNDLSTSSFSEREGRGVLVRKMSKRLSQALIRRRSSIVESLPETPAGWTVLVAAVLSAILGYELRLQHSLTKPPTTFCQLAPGSIMERIYQQMTASSESILSRTIQPSLFVGTRGLVSSTAAYLMGGPNSMEKYVRFRELLTMYQDGARVAVDWEVPRDQDGAVDENECKRIILEGPIVRPVVVILHGINNDSSFGYMRSLQRTFVRRGWAAASMNFRGCGGVRLTTPRGYNGAYTGDLRSLIHTLSARLAENVPLFLVGNSLGANIMTKYLGEEGLSGTLPSCVAGAASLGNPLSINSSFVKFPFNVLMGLGVKKVYLENWKTIASMKDPHSREIFRNGLLSPTIAQFDNSASPLFIRNNTQYPFNVTIGYNNGDEYWFDASSYRYIRFISIPFLNLTAQDDFLVAKPSRNKIGYCLSNPNVMIVETQCGGHLGWQESPPESGTFGSTSSWADVATADFFDAVMRANNMADCASSAMEARSESECGRNVDVVDIPEGVHMEDELRKIKATAKSFIAKIPSRL